MPLFNEIFSSISCVVADPDQVTGNVPNVEIVKMGKIRWSGFWTMINTMNTVIKFIIKMIIRMMIRMMNRVVKKTIINIRSRLVQGKS